MQDTAPASDRGEQTRKSALIASLTPLPSALVRVGRHQRRLNSLAHVYCGDGSDIRTKKRKRKRKLKTRYRIRYGITLSTGPYGSSLFMLTPLLASPRVRWSDIPISCAKLMWGWFQSVAWFFMVSKAFSTDSALWVATTTAAVSRLPSKRDMALLYSTSVLAKESQI